MLKWIRDTFLLVLAVLVVGYIIGSLYGGSFDAFQWEEATRKEIVTTILVFVGICVWFQIMNSDSYD